MRCCPKETLKKSPQAVLTALSQGEPKQEKHR